MFTSTSERPSEHARAPRRLFTAALALTLALGPAPALAQGPEPAAPASEPTEPFFTATDALLAAGFVAGIFAFAPLDLGLAEELQDSALQAHDVMRDLAAGLRFMGFPGTVVIGSTMYLTGRIGDMPRVAAFGLHGTEAVVLSYVFVAAGKYALGRARPDADHDDSFDFQLMRGFDGDEFQAFPSGHTAAAFAAAAAVTAETRELWPEATIWVGPLLYTGATLVGVSRMYHNRHWATDVMAGAAIGTFSGIKVVRYHYRNPGNRVDRWLLPSALMPADDGIMLVWRIPAN